jgi:flagellar protein FliL
MVIILAVSSILSIAAVVLLTVDVKSFFEKKTSSAEEMAELSVDTDVITTNVGTGEFAIVQFNILVNNETAHEEIEKRKPEVRATIISTLAGMSKEELSGTAGLETLSSSVLTKINEVMEMGRVERVLITDFRMQ